MINDIALNIFSWTETLVWISVQLRGHGTVTLFQAQTSAVCSPRGASAVCWEAKRAVQRVTALSHRPCTHISGEAQTLFYFDMSSVGTIPLQGGT